MHEHGLEAILIGNEAAALQGVSVATMGFEFLFRKTPANVRKLKAIAKSLDATILKTQHPGSELFRLTRVTDMLNVNFVDEVHSTSSVEELRDRTMVMHPDGYPFLVASLADIERIKAEMTKQEALRAESERALIEQIRRLLSLPMDQRTHFLRKRIGIRASCL